MHGTDVFPAEAIQLYTYEPLGNVSMAAVWQFSPLSPGQLRHVADYTGLLMQQLYLLLHDQRSRILETSAQSLPWKS